MTPEAPFFRNIYIYKNIYLDMGEETVKLNDGSEVQIKCKLLGGRKAYRLAPKILIINGIETSGKSETVKCDLNSAVDICWDDIVATCPQRDDVCMEDMQRIYEKYAKKEIEFVIKKNLEIFGK